MPHNNVQLAETGLFLYKFYLFIRLGLNVALPHQNRSYRDSETKENVETQKRKQIGGNDRKRTQLKREEAVNLCLVSR